MSTIDSITELLDTAAVFGVGLETPEVQQRYSAILTDAACRVNSVPELLQTAASLGVGLETAEIQQRYWELQNFRGPPCRYHPYSRPGTTNDSTSDADSQSLTSLNQLIAQDEDAFEPSSIVVNDRATSGPVHVSNEPIPSTSSEQPTPV